jgi:hypothetical protein
MTLSKKIFIGSSVLFALLLIFLGIYNFAFKNTSPAAPAAKTVVQTTVDKKSSAARVTALSDEAVLTPAIDMEKSLIRYYSKDTGKTYQIDLDGSNKKTLSDKTLPGLADVIWSPDGTKVISKFIQDGATKFFYYNYSTNTGVPLKNNLDTVVWQNNNKIFYKYFDAATQERTLNIANPDGTSWNKIANLDYKNISIAPIPRTGLVSFWNSQDASLETAFASAPVLGGDQTSILKGFFGVDYLWNATGNTVLFSHSDQKNGSKIQLGIMNDHGGEFKNLGVATFVSKSVWSKDGKTIYYALPSSFPDNIVLPNDYVNKTITTDDSFWKLNTSTGEKTRILDIGQSVGKIDAQNLFMNADESILFFINKLDGKLYRLDL